jgi:hypothetical protein
MTHLVAKVPTVPIAFHQLMRVVALVDATNPHTRTLLDSIEAERFEMEVSSCYQRDVFSDASVGACIGIDGENLNRARRAKPMYDYFLAFEESFNRFPGFNYEVQGVYAETEHGRIQFHTYVIQE